MSQNSGAPEDGEDRKQRLARNLDEAVRSYVSELTGGDYLTGWSLVMSATVPNDPNATAYIHAESGQPPHVTAGLILDAWLRIQKILRDGGEEDEQSG